MYISYDWKDFSVIDSGDGEKLERWGDVVLRRPDPQAIWKKDTKYSWNRPDGWYRRSSTGGGQWDFNRTLPDSWTVSYKGLNFVVHPTGFKHTGLFPEQAANWDFMMNKIENAGREISVLNLFAYTGGATMACLKAGASVCHVDAAKGMVNWAKDNAAASHLSDAPVRWIVDDCEKFVSREIRRGHKYDAIVMDPPSYGRGPNGEVWHLEDKICELIELCSGVLSDNPLFFILNAYTTGLQPTVMKNLLTASLSRFDGEISAEEICLPTERGLLLPCGAAARFSGK